MVLNENVRTIQYFWPDLNFGVTVNAIANVRKTVRFILLTYYLMIELCLLGSK